MFTVPQVAKLNLTLRRQWRVEIINTSTNKKRQIRKNNNIFQVQKRHGGQDQVVELAS